MGHRVAYMGVQGLSGLASGGSDCTLTPCCPLMVRAPCTMCVRARGDGVMPSRLVFRQLPPSCMASAQSCPLYFTCPIARCTGFFAAIGLDGGRPWTSLLPLGLGDGSPPVVHKRLAHAT